MAPLDETSTIAKFLDKRGPGMQQLAYRVSDIDALTERLRDQGVRLLYDAPRRGTANSRINFIHPKDAGGVLIELVEPADEALSVKTTSASGRVWPGASSTAYANDVGRRPPARPDPLAMPLNALSQNEFRDHTRGNGKSSSHGIRRPRALRSRVRPDRFRCGGPLETAAAVVADAVDFCAWSSQHGHGGHCQRILEPR